MTYLTHWGLSEKPFEELCDTRFFFESSDHREALDRMLYIVKDHNMGMGLLTGEVGSGKTITKNVFQNSLSRHHFEVIGFENSGFCFEDILYDVNRRITFRDPRVAMTESDVLPSRDDKYLLMQCFKEKVMRLAQEEKRHLVLVFDEAQLMADSVLDEIKMLTNISSEAASYVSIFIVGQPELREKIHNLRQVDQRIFLRFHLNNLDFEKTVKYIQHRLRVAGIQEGEIFTSQGYEYIFRETAGIPREINRLCKLALTYGFSEGLDELSREELEVIVEDLRKHS
jgi:general secretion pathway protein A